MNAAVTVQEAVYRMKVEGKEKVDAAVQSVDGLAVSEEKLTRATRSTEQGFERLLARLDPAVRAQQQYQQAVEQVQRYEAAGIGTAQQRSQAIALATTRYEQATKVITGASAANDNFAKKTGLGAYQVQNLGFQLNDVATMLAMGQSPFMVLASQGGQIYQILGSSEKGVGGAIKGVASAITSLLGPLGLLGAGLLAVSTAAYAYYRLTKTEAPTAEKLLEEHARLVGVVKEAYDGATKSARDWYNQSSEVTRLQLQQQQTDLRSRLSTATGQALQGTLQKDFVSFFGVFEGNVDIASKFKPFSDAIYRLNEQLQAGSPNVREYVDEVARIGLANPELQKVAAEMIKSAESAAELDRKLKAIVPLLKLVSGGRLSSEEERAAGLGNGRSSVNAYDSLVQRTRDRIKELELEAKTAGQVEGAVLKMRLQHEAERAAKSAGSEVNQKIIDQLKEELALRTQIAAQAKLRAELEFERNQLGRNDTDKAVASRLRGAGLPVDMESPEAQDIRINRALEIKKELSDRDPFIALQREMESLSSLLNSGAMDWDTYAAAAQRAQANTVAGMFGLGSQLATALGTIFNEQKAGAYAAAVLNTAESITKTMAQYGATPWGLAAAAVAAATGAAQIATISRQSRKGGGGAPSASSGGGAAAPASAPAVQQPRAVHINLQGRWHSTDQVRELIEQINEYVGDGGTKLYLQ